MCSSDLSDAHDLIIRQKPHMDNAVPSGNAIMAQNLAKLYALTGDTKYRDWTEITLSAFSGRIEEQFPNMPGLLLAAEMLQNPVQIVLITKTRSQNYLEMRRAIFAAYLPNRAITILFDGTTLPEGHPAHGKTAIDGTETAYVCQGPVCSAPVPTPENHTKWLANLPAKAAEGRKLQTPSFATIATPHHQPERPHHAANFDQQPDWRTDNF